MDEMLLQEQAGYDNLCRWVKKECANISYESTELNNLLSIAFSALSHRPALLTGCVEELEKSRCASLVVQFLDALAKGAAATGTKDINGMAVKKKPIEMHAHDPIRYVGDMLAWIHQAVASESELIRSLFANMILANASTNANQSVLSISSLFTTTMDENDSTLELSSEPNENAENNGYTDRETNNPHIVRVLSQSFEGICRPFQVRVQQVLTETQRANEVEVIYRIANLLDFFQKTIQTFMPFNSPLCTTFEE